MVDQYISWLINGYMMVDSWILVVNYDGYIWILVVNYGDDG